MKMRCLYRSIVRGDVVKPGQVLDLTEDECKAGKIKRFFVPVEGAAAEVSAPAAVPAATGAAKPTVVAGLTREQALIKLQQAGAKVKGNIANTALVELYNQVFANAAEATAK